MTVDHQNMKDKKLYPKFEVDIVPEHKVKITVVEKEQEPDTTPTCPHCGSDNVYGVSRVVGYFSIINNWNKSKQAELKKRQKGNYWEVEE